ncbi:MAG: recombinase family protein [Eubacteriales bacterium]|nr:recombinase family protein [Eubacteriales bacterium]
MKRINAIYARQSVDRPDSISIESQIEFCKYELKGGSFKEYKDRGYSGKNTVRPQLQQLLQDIRRGEIAKVIVYKLDRISRSILDFSNMMELFQEYHVEFVSSTEKFDTSTPMGRAMLNICIVFAQLERETIQKRVSDAYYSRSQKGFRMGGRPPYGFNAEEVVIQGIHTKKLIEVPEQAEHVRKMFEMYVEPKTSYGDITRYFSAEGIQFYGKDLIRPMLAQLLRNPVYVRADKEIYRFFKSQGTIIVSGEEEFDGIHGCYLYQGRNVKEDKNKSLKGQMLVVAPHEGLISSDLWLRCRIKLFANPTIQANRKAVNTWLAGKIKCGRCGYALMSVKSRSGRQYLRCVKRLNNKACPGCGKVYTADVEAYVYQQMLDKLRENQTPIGYTQSNQNPRIKELSDELDELDEEIERLIDSLIGSGETLTSYINKRVEELETIRQEKMNEIIVQMGKTTSPEQLEKIVASISDWEHAGFEEKQFALDKLVTTVKATEMGTEIIWKI